MGVPIYVKADATGAELEEYQQTLQRSLEELLHRGDSYWQKS
jgi:hypothetical protein